MRIPRLSTRWLMVLVLASGLALGLILPAREVLASKEFHAHGFIARQPDGSWEVDDGTVVQPFWPRYRLRLLGRPWEGVPACLAGKSRVDEVCSKEDSDHFLRSCLFNRGGFLFSPTIDMRRKVRTLNGLPPDPRLEALAKSR